MQNVVANGYELLQGDEALFSVDGYNVARHWSHKGQPIKKTSRWGSAKPIVVLGVISAVRGVVYWKLGVHSFNAQDICEAM